MRGNQVVGRLHLQRAGEDKRQVVDVLDMPAVGKLPGPVVGMPQVVAEGTLLDFVGGTSLFEHRNKMGVGLLARCSVPGMQLVPALALVGMQQFVDVQ